MPAGAPCVAMAGVVTGLGNNHVFGITTLFAIPFNTVSRGVAAAPTTTGDFFSNNIVNCFLEFYNL